MDSGARAECERADANPAWLESWLEETKKYSGSSSSSSQHAESDNLSSLDDSSYYEDMFDSILVSCVILATASLSLMGSGEGGSPKQA